MSDRTVSTDALETLGTILEGRPKRDAIHLAVYSVIAANDTPRGAHIAVDGPRLAYVVERGDSRAVGIADPFAPEIIKRGEGFWLVIYPRVITSLRHVWTHPAFPDESQPDQSRFTREESKAYLEDVASRLGVSLEDVEQMRSDGCFRVDIDGDRQVPLYFWEHFANWTGRQIPAREQADWFHCGC